MTQPDLTTKTYPVVGPYAVGREHIRSFASATQNTHPLHHDVDVARAAGYSDVLAPPTYLVSLAQQAEAHVVADPDAKIDFSRVVHSDERFTHHRPVVAGDELQAQAQVTKVREMAGNRMVTSEVQITSTEGEVVATVTSTLLVRAED